MSLYQSPPDFLMIDGNRYDIDTDFRAWIGFQSIMTKNNSNDEKAADLLNFIMEMGLPFSESTLDAVLWFFKAGEDKKTPETAKNPSYDFDIDSAMIFSAFLTQYNVDLTVEKIHWWKFKAMFSSLSKDHMISTVMWARNADTSEMSKSMKDYVYDIRRSYPLSVDKPVHKMTLEERNQKWIDYVTRRFEEKKKGSMPDMWIGEQPGMD